MTRGGFESAPSQPSRRRAPPGYYSPAIDSALRARVADIVAGETPGSRGAGSPTLSGHYAGPDRALGAAPHHVHSVWELSRTPGSRPKSLGSVLAQPLLPSFPHVDALHALQPVA